jgi:zinc D-Ala-D-Ala carboxypeptidase
MKMKKLAMPFFLTALILAGFLAHGLLTKYGSATSLDSLPIDASVADAPAQPDLLILVNKDHALPDDYKVNLTAVGNMQVASVLVGDLTDMRDAAKRDGITLYIDSAYRSAAEQQRIYSDAVADHGGSDLNAKRAGTTAAPPGHSEHETGLALDFSFAGNENRRNNMWDWLGQNAYKYGFILRYADGKRPITGYKYEPWHYRYVGKDHAKAIFEQDLTLEEYLQARR